MRPLFPSATGGIELFDEFFDSGLEESVSPFLLPSARPWGVNLPLKASLIAAFLLLGAFIFSFISPFHSVANLLLLLCYFFAGIPALIASIEDICDLEINIDVLMTLAAFLSVVIGSGREGALLLVLFSFSGSMEEAVRTKAKGALAALKKLSPQKAFVVQLDGTLMERSVRDIPIGTQIHVKAHQVVPLDGEVILGASSVNLVHLTGESLPQTRSVGDQVPAGARNLEGALTLSVTHTSSDSTLARIIQLITEAQEAKPRLQQWFDKASNVYALSIISISCLVAALLPLFFSLPYFGTSGSIYRALAFLIAASPCALIIAIPIAYLSAVSVCAKQGILLKGGMILDALAQCKTIAFDKTGTLTTGELQYLGSKTYGENAQAMEMAYTLERSALHPIAYALVNHAQKHGVKLLKMSNFAQVSGYGLKGDFGGEEAFIGSSDWILPHLATPLAEQIREDLLTVQEKGELLTLLLFQSSVTLFRFHDTLRPNIEITLRRLREEAGMHLVMLTGDHAASAARVATQTGIQDYLAELRPEDKLAFISQHTHLAMVGDGINDAPALARAFVGISMGRVGSTTAVDASDIVLLQDNIELLTWLVQKARQVGRIVKQNVSIAAGAIIFATIPALLGWIPLWLAVILHEGGTVIVGLNALRLLKGTRHDASQTARAATGRTTQRGNPTRDRSL
jgi:Zn2+/Cd2+-exporting ATPase